MPAAATVSIVTPTLNAERYLRTCLASVRAQDVPSLEHLIVDGGSSDATAAIASDVGGVTWLDRPGLNQATALNEGLRRAAGDVVAWLNADDAYPPGAVKFVVEQFAQDPALDVLFGDCDVVGAQDQYLWRITPGRYDFRRLLRRGNYLAQPAVFLRSRVFEQVGLLDPSLEYGMDYDLWLRLRGLRVRYVPRVLATFRWHPTSKSATSQLAAWREIPIVVRRYGGRWTPELAWAYFRCRLTLARTRLARTVQR